MFESCRAHFRLPPSGAARIIDHVTRRRLGYVVWGSAFVVTIVPELLASINAVEKHLPFPTVSRTIGHLEVVNPAWEIFPTALIVLFVYALLSAPMPGRAARLSGDDSAQSEVRPFAIRAVVFAVLLVGVGIAAAAIWPDQHLAGSAGKEPNFYVAYAFWGTTFVIWVVLPTVTALRGRVHAYPSVTKTIVNLERAIRGRFGNGAAWAVGFVLVWGMAFLLLHLTLYPFPDITRELNRSEIACNGKVVSRLPHDRDPACHKGDYAGSSR
jgi:hypothetical protein